MMNKKLLAWVIAIIVVVFPFRKAFLSDAPPCIMMILSFLAVVAGIIAFYYLTLEKHQDHSHE